MRLIATLSLLCIITSCDATRSTKPVEDRGDEVPDTKPVLQPRQDEALSVAPLPAHVQRGVCLAHNWQDGGKRGYGTQANAGTLEHLDELGVEWISLTPFGWMKDTKSTEIRGEHLDQSAVPEGGETRARLEAAIAQAREREMKLVLKPHLWIRAGEWRGSIAPGGDAAWRAWWKSYRDFILYYAKIAQEFDVESFVVGVELVSAVREHPEEMLATLEAVREVYQGKITYSANWDEQLPDELWRAMDAIGTQLYPPLSKDPSPSVKTLREALRPHLHRWHELGERLERPVWLTEVGYKSAPTAVSEPFGWPEHLPDEARRKDEELQARAYAALLEELPEHPRIEGLYIWKYFTDERTDEEGVWGFSPRGKAAEALIKQAYSTP